LSKQNTTIMAKLNYLVLILSILILPNFLSAQCTELLWADEFEDAQIDLTKWNYEVDCDGGGNNELQCYTDRPENARVENGKLIITALEEDFMQHNYTSARLTTKNKGDFRYGRFEASIKLPYSQGLWPAFWLLPTDNVYGEWPKSGEIDIMELLGHEPDTILGTLHTGLPWVFNSKKIGLSSGTFADDFHEFAIEWSEDTIKWFLDDVNYHTLNSDSIGPWNPFNERFHVILNVAVGGSLPGNPDPTSVFPQNMEVDYVRIYGEPSDLIIDGDSEMIFNEAQKTYSVANLEGATYDWSFPGNTQIISGQGTNSITVNWGCFVGAVQVEINSVCGTTNLEKPVALRDLEIESPEELNINTAGVIFSIPEFSNSTYVWNIDGDATIISGQGTNSIVVDWGCQTSTVSVEVDAPCANLSAEKTLEAKIPSIKGQESVLENTAGVTYFIEPIPNSIYTWEVPADVTIVSGQGTNEVVLDFGINNADLKVIIENNCGILESVLPVLVGNIKIITTYEAGQLIFGAFGGSSFEVIDNPFPDNVNESAHCALTEKGEISWAGIFADLGYDLDFSVNSIFTIKIWSPVEGVFLFKLEDQNPGIEPFIEIPTDMTQTNQWVEYQIDFSDATDDAFDRIAFFFNFGNVEKDTFYFDDIILDAVTSTDEFKVQDKYKVTVFPNPTDGFLTVNFDEGLENIEKQLSIFDIQGKTIKYTKTKDLDYQFNLDEVLSGIYFLRVEMPGSILIKEIVIK